MPQIIGKHNESEYLFENLFYEMVTFLFCFILYFHFKDAESLGFFKTITDA